MPTFHLSYGKQNLSIRIDGSARVDCIEPVYTSPAPDPLQVVRDAIAHPVDGVGLAQFAAASRVGIAINDKTRPVPHEHLLPPLLDALVSLGIPKRSIRFFIATGTHLPMPPEEFPRILPPEIIRDYAIESHVCDDEAGLVYLGSTSRGTPVWVNRRYLECDLRIVVGNIEPHHFAGFSGGYKTAAIGLTGRKTINPNHSMLVDPGAVVAEFANNPLRQDIEEIGDAIGVHFALNAVLNSDQKIVSAVSGSPRAVMQAGIGLSRSVCQVGVQDLRSYDLTIASVGGAPKDINFYQSQKALTHASMFTRDGGVIILAAACPEGSGSQAYEQFMEGITTPQQVFEKFRALGFRVGPHKAFQVARDAARLRIILVSQIDPGLVSRLLMTPAADLQQAMGLAVETLAPLTLQDLKIAVLPHATNTVPAAVPPQPVQA